MNLRDTNRFDKQKVIAGTIRVLLFLYQLFYVALFAGYFFFVSIVHSSFSIISVPAAILPYLLLLAFLYVLWKSKTAEERPSTIRRIRIVSILGLIPVFLLLVVLWKNELDTTFDQIRWQSEHDVRVYMVDNLLEEHNLLGLSRKEVFQLLGQPEETEYFKEKDNIVYWLGPERGLIRIDSEWLVIRFDDHDKVTSVKITRD